MEKFLTTLAGARQEILALCPVERLKFQNLGWAILITSGIATVSMWFALTTVMGINAVLAFPVAVVWGLVIMGIDRWLVTSIPPRGSRRLAIALPRLFLAILLGTLISTPITLRIFQTAIRNEIVKLDNSQQQNFVAQQQKDPVSQQVAKLQTQVAALQSVVNARGMQPLDLSADPQVRSLTAQRDSWLQKEQQYFQQWQCQLYDIPPGCKRGNGPLANAAEQNYNIAKQEVSSFSQRIQAREQQLGAANSAAAPGRLAQAQSQLNVLRPELSNYQQQETQTRDSYYSTRQQNGLLANLQALDALAAQNGAVSAARYLIFLFFLVIECLPITVKLLQRPGVYEAVLEEQARAELKGARRAIRSGLGPADLVAFTEPAGSAGAAGAAGSPDATATRQLTAPVRAPASRDFRRDAVREVWQLSEDMAPMRSSAAAELVPDDPGPRSRLDGVLRAMQDARPPAGRPDGSEPELRYDDDDL